MHRAGVCSGQAVALLYITQCAHTYNHWGRKMGRLWLQSCRIRNWHLDLSMAAICNFMLDKNEEYKTFVI